jgi:thiol-disulfide isomerase/thioredoxin
VTSGLPSLTSANGWLNSKPLTTADLQGKVVVVQFWTYSCINWLRTLPYVRAWAEKYVTDGLVTIGVHSPEFSFEHDLDNVRRAATELRVDYPIAIDNDFAIWRAFENHYWPALYLVDAQDDVRHHHFGEGEYEQSERAIQRVLGIDDRDLVAVDTGGVEAAADWSSLKSPESYVGYERAENRVEDASTRLKLNRWALAGDWTVEPEDAVLNTAGGTIAYRFHARDLNLVMGPVAPEASVRFRVLVDGQPPGADHGLDVDDQGNGTVTEPRLYQLVRQRARITERTFELTFLDPGARVYVFTFG